jgi:hypothetical protein
MKAVSSKYQLNLKARATHLSCKLNPFLKAVATQFHDHAWRGSSGSGCELDRDPSNHVNVQYFRVTQQHEALGLMF